MLEDSVERIHHASSFADIPRGVFLIRGENVVLLGEIVSILARAIPSLPLYVRSIDCLPSFLSFFGPRYHYYHA